MERCPPKVGSVSPSWRKEAIRHKWTRVPNVLVSVHRVLVPKRSHDLLKFNCASEKVTLTNNNSNRLIPNEWGMCGRIETDHKEWLLLESFTPEMAEWNNTNTSLKKIIKPNLETSPSMKTRSGFNSEGLHFENSFRQLCKTVTGVTISAVFNPKSTLLIALYKKAMTCQDNWFSSGKIIHQ